MSSEIKTSEKKIMDKRVKNLMVFIISLILVFGIGYTIFNYVPFVAKYNSYSILTPSMDPVLKVGDLVLVDTSVKPEDLEPGEIIAFWHDITPSDQIDNPIIVVHYLDSVENIDGINYYTTRHVNPNPQNPDESLVDNWTLIGSDIVGREVFMIPKVGPLVVFAKSTIGRIVLIIDIVVIYGLIEYYNSGKKKEDKPEELNIDEKKDTD